MEGLDAANTPEMRFEIATNAEGTATVTISGELDIANVERLEAAVRPIIDGRPDRLVLDVHNLQFADTSAIALWVRWAAILGHVDLKNASSLLRRVIGAMGLDDELRLQ
jgi:anti-anti-sigma factor